MNEADAKPKGTSTLVRLAGIIAIVLIGLVCLPPSGPSRRSSAKSICQFNLRRIGAALRQYHDVYGSYPPAYIADAEGVPIHSWRTLLYPYFYFGVTFPEYSFDEPWDGPNNILLAKDRPREFHCPAAAGDHEGFTNYVAVTGPGTVFDGPRACRHEDIPGHPWNMIMVVEIADSDIPWTCPRDLSVETMNLTIGVDRHGMSSNHAGGVNVLYCAEQPDHLHGSESRDCPRAEFLESSTSPAQLKRMLQFHRNEDEVGAMH